MKEDIDKSFTLMQLTDLYLHASKFLHSPIDFSIDENIANYMDKLIEAMHSKRLEMLKEIIK